MKCAKHPRYRAKQAPRVACRSCWALFFGVASERPSIEKRVAALEGVVDKMQRGRRGPKAILLREARTLHADVDRYLSVVPLDCDTKYARLLRRTRAMVERLCELEARER